MLNAMTYTARSTASMLLCYHTIQSMSSLSNLMYHNGTHSHINLQYFSKLFFYIKFFHVALLIYQAHHRILNIGKHCLLKDKLL